MSLENRFARVLSEPRAKKKLASLAGCKRLPLYTFNLATTSLRHLPAWFDRLEDIKQGRSRTHGNFFSDPAAIGLVDNSVRPRVLTPAGEKFLSYKPYLYKKPAEAEYRLVEILYFSGFSFNARVQSFLHKKRRHMLRVLKGLVAASSPKRQLFLAEPRLLVIIELIANFPGALKRFVALSENDLKALVQLGEKGFDRLGSNCTLYSGDTLRGFKKLCHRIGSDYTRAEERRLHYIFSMTLLEIKQSISLREAKVLTVPAPFSNLINEFDIYRRYSSYTTDITVWLEDSTFFVSAYEEAFATTTPVQVVTHRAKIQPQTKPPSGVASKPVTAPVRQRRKTYAMPTVYVSDPIVSERSEDLVEQALQAKYRSRLIRVGHREGEIYSLSDGLVPGADFYVVDKNNQPVEFIEVKSVTRQPPVEISITRAELTRAIKCSAQGKPYVLMLVNVATNEIYNLGDVARQLANLQLTQVSQFTVKIS